MERERDPPEHENNDAMSAKLRRFTKNRQDQLPVNGVLNVAQDPPLPSSQTLGQSPWGGHMWFELPGNVQPMHGLITAIRQSIAVHHPAVFVDSDKNLYVGIAVRDDSEAAREVARGVAAHVLNMLPGAKCKAIEIDFSPSVEGLHPESVGPRASLRLVSS